jgi:hypothetical protein
VSKAVGERWVALSAEEKAPYEKRHEESRLKYASVRDAYKLYATDLGKLKQWTGGALVRPVRARGRASAAAAGAAGAAGAAAASSGVSSAATPIRAKRPLKQDSTAKVKALSQQPKRSRIIQPSKPPAPAAAKVRSGTIMDQLLGLNKAKTSKAAPAVEQRRRPQKRRSAFVAG